MALVGNLFSCKLQEKSKTEQTQNIENTIDAEMTVLVKKMKVPVFKNKVCKVADFGAIANGKHDNTAAFARAIITAVQQGEAWY